MATATATTSSGIATTATTGPATSSAVTITTTTGTDGVARISEPGLPLERAASRLGQARPADQRARASVSRHSVVAARASCASSGMGYTELALISQST